MKPCIRTAVVTIAAVSSLFAAVPASADTMADQATHAALLAKSAPADEYFGPLALSVLGIRNTIAQDTLRLDRAGMQSDDSTKSVELVEESVREWETKYPADSWLPRMVLALHHAYRKIATSESMQRSIDTASWLISRYPKSAEATTARGELVEAMSSSTPDDASQAQASDGSDSVDLAPLPPYAQR